MVIHVNRCAHVRRVCFGGHPLCIVYDNIRDTGIVRTLRGKVADVSSAQRGRELQASAFAHGGQRSPIQFLAHASQRSQRRLRLYS